jgi:hypothetical protein
LVPEVVGLRMDGPKAVAVRASDLAVGHLPLYRDKRVFVECKREDARTLRSDVIEVQDDDIALAAVDTPCPTQVFDDDEEVASTKRAIQSVQLVQVGSPRGAATSSALAVAVDADQLAFRDLGLNVPQGISLMNELGHVGSLLAEVIELEEQGVDETAVRTATGSKDVQHELARQRPTLIPGRLRLA